MEAVKIDPKKCDSFEDLAQDSSEYKNKIHITNHKIVGIKL